MQTGKINYKALGVLALLFCAMPIWSQVDSTYRQWGSFPKKEPKGTKNIQVNGFYRFYSTYTTQDLAYPLTSALGDVVKSKSLFIGDDAQLPNLLVNVTGNLKDGSSWGLDVRMFQFLNGQIGSSYSAQVADSLRPDIQTPLSSNTLGKNLGAMLGMTLYGNFKTQWGSWSTRLGGIQWIAISDLTMSSFKGYNRFMLFERNPWDPLGRNLMGRYQQYFEQGSIDQDNRWGNRAFQGAVLEGQLPGAVSVMVVAGKTELNGGFVATPNYSWGGKVKKDFSWGSCSINSLNAKNFIDSLALVSFGSYVVTNEWLVKFKGHQFKVEYGGGKYYSPNHNRGWGELVQAKWSSPQSKSGLSWEWTAYRISPKVVNNVGLYWNTAIKEYAVNDIPAGSVGSASLLQPFASSMTRLGQMTNNRQGINFNFQWTRKNFQWSGGIGSSKEIERVSNQITLGHPVNQLVRSRMWRWNFPSQVGPYNRYSDIYRDVYQTVNLSDDSSGVVVYDKYFNNAELQMKWSEVFLDRPIYAFGLFQAQSASRMWSPVLITSEKAYVRQYSSELEIYYAIMQRCVLSIYGGMERTLGNYNTNIDENSFRPMNQYGTGYGFGLDVDLGKNARLYVRQRWFEFQDKSFDLDHFKGKELSVELKAFF
ncbi:MAG: hypothetical protein FJX95_06585 [Bacteroidetes bacterium]|nr:hypothetical protein [Bacteroidota bacterium]